MTCQDNEQNGDETGLDCGGDKCKKCPDTEPEIIPDSLGYGDNTTEGGGYCDVSEAVNYETHSEKDSSLQADANSCNFCGNGKTDGKVKSDGTVEPVTFTGTVSGVTTQASESCDDGENDKPYDGCSACRIESCGDELALCREYNFNGGEEEGDLSGMLRKGITGNSASKRPEWNNHGVDVVKTKGRDYATFGATCIRNRDKKITSYTGYSTMFALNYNGSDDLQDPGVGSTAY